MPNCELRACVSVPGFSPQNIVPYLNDKNSPLLNRILASFNLGSIFKIITSASAIEYGIDSKMDTNLIDLDEIGRQILYMIVKVQIKSKMQHLNVMAVKSMGK